MQSHFCRFDFAVSQSLENLRSEVQAGSGGGDRSAFAGIDGLVAVAIVSRVFTRDVGRQRDVSDCFDLDKEVIRWDKTNVALAEFSTGDNFSLQFVVISEEKMLADRDLSAGADEALPVVRIGLQLTRQEGFDASMKKFARCRIVRTESLRLKTSAAAIQACGKHPGVVEDDKVAGTEKVGEVAKLTIVKLASGSGKVEKPRCRAVRERLLGN